MHFNPCITFSPEGPPLLHPSTPTCPPPHHTSPPQADVAQAPTFARLAYCAAVLELQAGPLLRYLQRTTTTTKSKSAPLTVLQQHQQPQMKKGSSKGGSGSSAPPLPLPPSTRPPMENMRTTRGAALAAEQTDSRGGKRQRR